MRERPVYLREAFLSRIKSNSLTYTVDCSFVCTSPLAATTVVGLLRFQFGRVQVFPAEHVHTRAGIYNKFSFLRLVVDGSGKLLTLGGEKKVALSVFLSFKMFLGRSPRVSADTSLMSFNLFLRPGLKFHSTGTALMRNFDLYFTERWSFCFRGCLRDVA